MQENHPDLFEKAKEFEKYDEVTGKRYTWSQGETLDEVLARKDEIKEKFALLNSKEKRPKNLIDSIDSVLSDEDDDEDGCLICML